MCILILSPKSELPSIYYQVTATRTIDKPTSFISDLSNYFSNNFLPKV
jgi:hypothetical protein